MGWNAAARQAVQACLQGSTILSHRRNLFHGSWSTSNSCHEGDGLDHAWHAIWTASSPEGGRLGEQQQQSADCRRQQWRGQPARLTTAAHHCMSPRLLHKCSLQVTQPVSRFLDDQDQDDGRW